ncbi:hypothetical protein [uncultured Nostoc sp.]|uniref:hypothetical protein n=1 Tax=uncultured Nostoc sp. TaxID=340711 RepID=UPI0035CC9737
MGIEGNFKQISATLLEIAKQDLYVLDLYLHAKEALETGAVQHLPAYLKKKELMITWTLLLVRSNGELED